MLRRLGLFLLFSTSIPALTVGPAAGQAAPDAAPPAPRVFDLDATTTTATREERPLVDVPASVTVIDQRELERRNPHTIRDVIRYEPGVNVGNQPARAGATNYNIRGIGENRVRIQIDGVRVPDFPGSNIGAGTYTRDFVDFDVLRRVEIVRGPASALYGSDAIGGVVSYVTRDPAELLAESGRDWFVGGRTSWDSADRSWSQNAIGAGRAGAFEVLTMYSHRDGHQTNPNARAGTIVNPQEYQRHNFIGKVVWNPSATDRVRFTAEFFRNDADTNLLTDLGATVRDSRASDQTQRLRLSIDHVHDGRIGFADRLEWRLYYTNLQRRELTDQLRFTAGTLRLRHSNFFFNQDIVGGEVQFTNRFTTGTWQHSLIWGASTDVTFTTRPRERFETNLATGVTTTTVASEAFPNKTFPDSRTIQFGAYVQNEIRLGASGVTLLPAIRFDYYNLNPNPDADFQRTNPSNFQVSRVTATALSPKFGVTWRVVEPATLFAQYARGFRSPPYDDANIGFTNLASFYEILPNPNLRPETSNSFEVGMRLRLGAQATASLAGFYNLYSDFIDTVVVGTTGGGITQYQPRNITRARIYGAEARGEWRFHDEWTLNGALAYARGINDETGTPLDSVAPLMGVAGLAYDHRGGRFGARVNAIFAAEHERVSNPAYFRAPSYAVADITAYYEPVRNVRLTAGVYNLFDVQYFPYLDVVGIARTNTQRDRYAAPGRTFTAALTLRW